MYSSNINLIILNLDEFKHYDIKIGQLIKQGNIKIKQARFEDNKSES